MSHHNWLTEPNKKTLRTIGYALDPLYGRKAWISPKSIDDFKVSDPLLRWLHLDNGRSLLLSDAGLEWLKGIESAIASADILDGLANYADIANACRAVLVETLSQNLRPEDATEFIALVRKHLAPLIDNWTYAVPISGIELVEIESFALGSMEIVPAKASCLDKRMVIHDHTNVEKTIDVTKTRYWLVGTTRGTEAVSKEKFSAQAQLVVGMLAISAASMYDRGASSFRINVVMSPEEAYGRSAWFSWSEGDRSLTTTHKFRRSQDFRIDADLVNQFDASGIFERVFSLMQIEARTPLEDAIVKAIYWYSDAHREDVPVMKLIKYWSCVETFFSTTKEDITRSVSVGLATVLVFGGYRFVPSDEYANTKKRIAKLYDLRSRAVHRGLYRHVSDQDSACLSQWVAWMLINMVTFVLHGYTQLEQIKAICERLEDRESTPNSVG